MGSISRIPARKTETVTRRPERRRSERRKAQRTTAQDRRRTAALQHEARAQLDLSARDLLVNTALAPKNTTIEVQAVPGSRRAGNAPPPLILTDRQSRNLLWRGYFNDTKANVERKLGWRGVHGIRGWSGMGAAVATAVSVGMLVAAAFTPMFPGLGVIAFVAAYLALTAVGVAVQWAARRNRLPLVEPQRQGLEALRRELKALPVPSSSSSSASVEDGEEDALLADVERLLKDINGGFWWGMRCALSGFLDPTEMLREFVRGAWRKRRRRTP